MLTPEDKLLRILAAHRLRGRLQTEYNDDTKAISDATAALYLLPSDKLTASSNLAPKLHQAILDAAPSLNLADEESDRPWTHLEDAFALSSASAKRTTSFTMDDDQVLSLLYQTYLQLDFALHDLLPDIGSHLSWHLGLFGESGRCEIRFVWGRSDDEDVLVIIMVSVALSVEDMEEVLSQIRSGEIHVSQDGTTATKTERPRMFKPDVCKILDDVSPPSFPSSFLLPPVSQ